MDVLDGLDKPIILHGNLPGVLEIEGILEVPCRMVLRNEQHIQIPECRMDVLSVVLCESHIGEEFLHVSSETGERVFLGRIVCRCEGLYIEPPELHILPLSALDEIIGYLDGLLLDLDALCESLPSEVGERDASLGDDLLCDHSLTALEVLDELGIGLGLRERSLRHPGEKYLIVHPSSEHLLSEICEDEDLGIPVLDDVRKFLPLEPADSDLVLSTGKCIRKLRHVHPSACGIDDLDGLPLGKTVLDDGHVRNDEELGHILVDGHESLGREP